MLDRALLAVGELHFHLLLLFAAARHLTTHGARFFRALARRLPAHRAHRRRLHLAPAGPHSTRRTRLLGLRRSVPLLVVEVVVRFHEVVDREVVLAIVEPRAATDDLLKLDHRIDRAHEDDVSDVARIDAGRKFLRRGQDRRNRLLVVLKRPQMLLAELAVVGRDPLAVVGVLAGLDLVDVIPDGQRVILRGAEHQRLFPLVDRAHENIHALPLARLDFDYAVEILFLIEFSFLHHADDHRVVLRVNIVVERRRNLAYAKRREKPVVDPFLERVGVDRLAKVGVGIDVVLPLRRRRETELHRRREVVEDAAPVAFVVRTAAMALVNDDEIEKVRRIFAEVGRGHTVLGRARHKRLEDGEEQAGILRHRALFADVLRLHPHERVVGKRGKRREIIMGLRRERVAVGQEKDARAPRRLARLLPLREIPPRLKELPRDLKRDGRFSRARRQREQNAVFLRRDPLQHPVDRDLLVESQRPAPALVRRRHRGKAVAPRVRLGECHRPQFVWRRIRGHRAFLARLHVDGVDALAIRRVGEAHAHLARVVLRLRHAFRQRLVPRLGFVHRELAVAIDQHVVGGERLAAFAVALDAARRDGMFPQNLAALDDAPARRFQGGVNVLGAGLGFVHQAEKPSENSKARYAPAGGGDSITASKSC